MALKISKSGRGKSRGGEAEALSSEQPIECVFADMSDRLMKIQRDLLMPAFIFENERVQNTITFFGSARIKPEAAAIAELKAVQSNEKLEGADRREALSKAKTAVEMSKYYTQAEELARRFQEWSNTLDLPEDEKFYIMTGGGPGIMEAANRGAYIAGGKTVGATITIPDEQARNTYVRNGVWINFHYFLMRKFWLLFFAKALIAFPGGTGTFDEFFEVFTLMKTRKTDHYIPTVLFGKKFWENVVDFDYMVKTDVITKSDLKFFRFADSVDEAYEFVTSELERTMKLKPIK
ncbi:MAG: lysine decarboxylase [Verrucomicrobia bacterium]|nr:MAG: lysine decarboxylase [Verrucomicrobiota bacterium]